ncbi:MAG: hypothetical protein LBI96_05790 [Odoribacteraceae bacterium]|jgi:two-component SAPR family response regulator|nr:hypothetical protein [Odoribacteraceae bacterium]
MYPRKTIRETILTICLSCTLAIPPAGGATTGAEPVAGLALNNGHFFRFNNDIRLSFQLAPERGRARYIAYLVRLSDLNRHAVNIILDIQDENPGILLVSGEKLARMPIDAAIFAAPSIPFTFHFDLKRDQLALTVGDTLLEITRLGLHPRADYKISVGGASASAAPFLLSGLQADPDILFSRKFSGGAGGTLFWIVGIVLVDMLVFIIYARGKRRRKRQRAATDPAATIVYTPARDDHQEAARASAIYLFGGFRVFDRTGKEISKRFTPLLKELFLILLLHSRRDPAGIAPATLKELLWIDKGLQSANNNRAVNIGKMKAILDTVGAYELTSNSSAQRLELGEEIFCDYYALLRLSRQQSLDMQQINHLMHLVRKGALLPDCHYEWLDAFKADISGMLIDTLVGFASVIDHRQEARFVTRLADTVFLFDPLNEEALLLKCKALILLGKHSLANATHARFAKEYELLYGIAYGKNFSEISRPS